METQTSDVGEKDGLKGELWNSHRCGFTTVRLYVSSKKCMQHGKRRGLWTGPRGTTVIQDQGEEKIEKEQPRKLEKN